MQWVCVVEIELIVCNTCPSFSSLFYVMNFTENIISLEYTGALDKLTTTISTLALDPSLPGSALCHPQHASLGECHTAAPRCPEPVLHPPYTPQRGLQSLPLNWLTTACDPATTAFLLPARRGFTPGTDGTRTRPFLPESSQRGTGRFVPSRGLARPGLLQADSEPVT